VSLVILSVDFHSDVLGVLSQVITRFTWGIILLGLCIRLF